MLNKTGDLVLALRLLLLAAASPATVQQDGISGSNEKVVSMNVLSSDWSYIVYVSWQPNDTDVSSLTFS